MIRPLVQLLLMLLCCLPTVGQQCYVFIGSYNDNANSNGLYVYKLDTASGRLEKVTSAKVFNPSFLTLSGNGKYVFACTETKTPNAGSVSSYSFDKVRGRLTFISKQRSGGENPVYVALDKSEQWLVNANYTEGSISAYRVDANGSIQPAAQVIPFAEGSINKERQERAHIHAAVFSPDGEYIFFPDLGADKIRSYALDADAATPLREYVQPFTKATSGSGPRHLAFHPNGQYAYCVEELSGYVQAYSYSDGRLDSIQRLPVHKGKKKGDYNSADIHCSPDGRFLYASNRGTENNISIFAVDEANGKLSQVGYQPTLGDHPRNFSIDPSGKFLLVANQITGNVVVFRRDTETGLLKYSGTQIKIPGASCVQIKYIF